MAKRIKESVRDAIINHHKTLERVINRQALAGLRVEFDAGIAALARDLRGEFKGMRKEKVTADMLMRVRTVANERIIKMMSGIAGELADQTDVVTREGVHSLGRFLSAVRGGQASPLDDPRVAESLALRYSKSLKRGRRMAAASVGVDMADVIKGSLYGFVDREARVDELLTEAVGALDAQWWRVERTAKTETCAAYNRVHDTGIAYLAKEMDGVRKRWTEHVSDITGEPLDDRVAQDSLILHGQIAGDDGLFYMPNEDGAPDTMIGMSWEHPPNRPNDRAILIPWTPEMGIPAWVFKNGRRISL